MVVHTHSERTTEMTYSFFCTASECTAPWATRTRDLLDKNQTDEASVWTVGKHNSYLLIRHIQSSLSVEKCVYYHHIILL